MDIYLCDPVIFILGKFLYLFTREMWLHLNFSGIYNYIHLDHIEVFMLHYYGGTPTRFEIHTSFTVSGKTQTKHVLSYETATM